METWLDKYEGETEWKNDKNKKKATKPQMYKVQRSMTKISINSF